MELMLYRELWQCEAARWELRDELRMRLEKIACCVQVVCKIDVSLLAAFFL